MWPRLSLRQTSLAGIRVASIRPGSPGRISFRGRRRTAVALRRLCPPPPGKTWSTHPSELHKDRAGSGQDQTCDCRPGESLSQEEPRQQGYPDEHRGVDHARFDRRQRPQGVIPQGEGQRRVDQRQPQQHDPLLKADRRDTFPCEPDRQEDGCAESHADCRDHQR